MVAVRRFPILAMGAASLIAGLLAGLARLGWDTPEAGLRLAALHGPLMVSAFFGTLIGLERAVALNRPWGYAAPIASGVGGLVLLAGISDAAGMALLAVGSAVFLAMASAVIARQRELFTAVLWLGAACWLAGNLMWLAGRPLDAIVAPWALFLVLTIAGERVELSRFLKPTPTRGVEAVVPLALLLATPILALADADLAWRVFGAGLLLLALWMARHDVARRTIRQKALTRYVAVCLLSGYVWLAFGGALAATLPMAGTLYDAVLHAVFVGFVFAMVFGHAPIILPAVLRVGVPYAAVLYAPLALLHASLALRLAGDLADLPAWRQWGGLLNAAAIVFFLATAATLAVRAARARRAAPGRLGVQPE